MTPLPTGSPLGEALRRGRERFNGRVALARREGRRLDPAALAAHLTSDVAPAVAAVAAAAPGRVDAVTAALFELSLGLLAQEVLGPASRHPLAVEAWRSLLPALAVHLAAAPARVAAAVTNAAWNLGRTAGARGEEWLAGMAALAPRCAGPDELLECGKVLAWRAGLAHFRASALEAWERLPEPLAVEVLEDPGEVPASRAELRATLADRWRRPGAPPGPPGLLLAGAVGGFLGFGGPFRSPPRVVEAGGTLWATDGASSWTIHADCFGRTLQPAEGAPEAPRASLRERLLPRRGPAWLAADGTLTVRGVTARLLPLAGASGFAATEDLVAVTHARSHRVLLAARTGGVA